MLEMLKFFVYVLAAYGIITLAINIFEAFRSRAAVKNAKVRLVLIVKDAEEYAEYIVRTAVNGEFSSKVLSKNKITIINMNSRDGTAKILDRLSQDYECLEVLEADERERIFEGL